MQPLHEIINEYDHFMNEDYIENEYAEEWKYLTDDFEGLKKGNVSLKNLRFEYTILRQNVLRFVRKIDGKFIDRNKEHALGHLEYGF